MFSNTQLSEQTYIFNRQLDICSFVVKPCSHVTFAFMSTSMLASKFIIASIVTVMGNCERRFFAFTLPLTQCIEMLRVHKALEVKANVAK